MIPTSSGWRALAPRGSSDARHDQGRPDPALLELSCGWAVRPKEPKIRSHPGRRTVADGNRRLIHGQTSKNTHVHPLKDASHALRMEQPRPMDRTKVQTLAALNKLLFNAGATHEISP